MGWKMSLTRLTDRPDFVRLFLKTTFEPLPSLRPAHLVSSPTCNPVTVALRGLCSGEGWKARTHSLPALLHDPAGGRPASPRRTPNRPVVTSAQVTCPFTHLLFIYFFVSGVLQIWFYFSYLKSCSLLTEYLSVCNSGKSNISSNIVSISL